MERKKAKNSRRSVGLTDNIVVFQSRSDYAEFMNKTLLFAALILLNALGMAIGATETQTQPATGAAAPDFKLTTGDGSQVSLKDYRGKWVVLYFYPKDFTSGCTMEAKNFQRDLAKYEQSGAVVLGVSVDSAQSHKDFCAKEGLNFKLLPIRTQKCPRNMDRQWTTREQRWRRGIRSSLIQKVRSRRFIPA